MSNVQIPKYSSELCSSSIAMLATVTQILPVPDSFKLLEIIYGYKFDSFFHIYSPFSIGYNIPSFF